jgi:anaerobic magnesium-protoporphyrin IX monomethyl ester cyclase
VEETAAELFAAWAGDADAPLDGIHGLVLPASGGPGEVRRTRPRERTRELDSLPFPAVDLVDAERYRAAWTGAHGRLSWNMVTSRGCPYRCNWCAKPIFGKLYAQRSPATVASELQHLRQTVAPDHIWFADDIFGLTAPWIEGFAREVTARGARTPFMMQSRANLMTPATVAALRRAGAEEVWMGVESGSQRVLDAMDKGTSIAQVRSATRAPAARAAAIMVSAASRMRTVHILVRKLKLSSKMPTAAGRRSATSRVNSSTPSDSMASKSRTSCPRSRSTDAVISVASGGYGFIFWTCLGS